MRWRRRYTDIAPQDYYLCYVRASARTGIAERIAKARNPEKVQRGAFNLGYSDGLDGVGARSWAREALATAYEAGFRVGVRLYQGGRYRAW